MKKQSRTKSIIKLFIEVVSQLLALFIITLLMLVFIAGLAYALFSLL